MTVSPLHSPDIGKLRPPESPEQSILWLSEVIEWFHERAATDLHLQPREEDAALWVRIDGQLSEVARYPIAAHNRMIARLKVLGRCTDYAGELVQEGRFSLNGSTDSGEARLSIVPTLWGEKAVLRLLQGGGGLRKLDELGFAPELVEVLRVAMDLPQGLILSVGPSGSGKSAAIYAMIDDLLRRTGHPVSTITIEDPIEQSLPGAAQVPIDSARGFGFAEGLRAVLRQDPEVIMVGEIRDTETAQAALQAALTGHQLLSSMHTLSAAEALVRLRQMGAATFEIAAALAGLLNTRLLRRLCPQCKTTREATPEEEALIPEIADFEGRQIAEAAGCESCMGTGHAGRFGLGEWIVPKSTLAEGLKGQQSVGAVQAHLEHVVEARPTLLDAVREGVVCPAEVRRLAGIALAATQRGASGSTE